MERVARTLLQVGPATAADLADTLGMTSAGVRRHLATLMDEGLVVAHDRAPYGPTPKRGRGRPSAVFTLTETGRAACDQADDGLALTALRFMADTYGAAAVEAFAVDRARRLTLVDAVTADGEPVASLTPEQLATVLSQAGYAAEVEPLGDVAVQLCQHHCPVIDAAREFPVLCEAETTELARVLGRHVTRLATLAHGDAVCTAVLAPVGAAAPAPAPNGTSHRSTNREVLA